MKRPATHVQAMRDALLAVLRDAADVQLTTQEVIERAYPGTGCRHYSKVYQNLRAMDRLGIVTWHPWDSGTQCTRWSATAEDRVDPTELETLWQMEADR